MRRNALKDLFEKKQTALGGWCAIGNPYSAEVLGHSGYDTVVVDLQHGLIFLDQAMAMLTAISATPAMPMARVAERAASMVIAWSRKIIPCCRSTTTVS